jgi:protoporphyrinogen oxidase
VVGAGLSGLAAAYDLKDREVLVLEAGSRPGGVCLPGSYQGVPYPAGSAYFYHDPEDQETLAWYRELGLRLRRPWWRPRPAPCLTRAAGARTAFPRRASAPLTWPRGAGEGSQVRR